MDVVLNWTNGIKLRGSRDENRWIRVNKDGGDLKVLGFRVFHRFCSFGQLRERIRSQLWVRGMTSELTEMPSFFDVITALRVLEWGRAMI